MASGCIQASSYEFPICRGGPSTSRFELLNSETRTMVMSPVSKSLTPTTLPSACMWICFCSGFDKKESQLNSNARRVIPIPKNAHSLLKMTVIHLDQVKSADRPAGIPIVLPGIKKQTVIYESFLRESDINRMLNF